VTHDNANQPSPTTSADLLSERLAAVPPLQLEALHRAIDASMGFGASVLSWMRELVQWETARRCSQGDTPGLPRATALDMPGAVLTLSVLVAVFQSSTGGGVDVQPTIDLLDAIRQTLLSWGGEASTLH
jgi:hypothetical protein